MPLRLTIENFPSLPDGGPVSYTVSGKRGLDIGRDQYLDWVLPDPNRVVSGKHCEIRYQDGGYWLRDVSTNGTFVNRSERRVQEPHRLRTGDRVEIGPYIINVQVEGEEAGPAPGAPGGGAGEGAFWGAGDGVAPPIDARQLKPNIARPVQSLDVLDWVAAVPDPVAQPMPPGVGMPPPRSAPLAPPTSDDLWGGARPASEPPSWAPPPPQAPPPPPPIVPADAWGGPPAAAPPPRAPAWDGAPPPSAAPLAGMTAPPGAMPQASPPSPPPGMPPVPGAGMPSARPLEPPYAEAPPEPAMRLDGPPPAIVPTPRTPDRPAPPRTDAPPSGSTEVVRRFAKGAGLPVTALAGREPGELAEQLGELMHLVAAHLGQLLAARAESKGAMRSARQTLIQAADNNPLRFTPSAQEALGIMFGPQSRSYLDARRTLEQSFNDLKQHQIDTFPAIQQAIQQLVADLDPKEIEKSTEGGGGVFANRKAKLWDNYLLRWNMKAGRHENGLLGAFMQYFAEAYDKRRR
jgi:type VI secretion system protein ImpI